VGQALPRPAIGELQGMLRVAACGLCGTDHEQFTGALSSAGPFIPGHEIIGVLEEAGPGAESRWGVQKGQLVALEVFRSCRECAHCLSGDYRHCERHGFPDSYGFKGLDRPPALWGGYAESVYLDADSVLLPVPSGLDPVIATLFNPLGAGLRWAVHLPGTRPGDVVAVLGPGIRGLCASAAAKEAGASFVLVTGSGDRDAKRLALARDFGADATVDVTVQDPVVALRSAAGTLADVVVDVTAQSPEAVMQSIRLAHSGGTVVVAGTRGSRAVADFAPDLLVFKELRLIGALGVDATAYRPALELLASGRWPFADLSRRCVDLDGAAGLLTEMAGEAQQPPPVHGVIQP
jgi:alcohol dehydrogenase